MEQICKKERRRKSFSSCRGSHLLSFFSRSASAAHLNSLCSSSSLGICEPIRAEKERCHQDDHLPTTLRRPLDSSNWITVAQLYTKTLESFPKFPIRSCWQPNIYFFHSRAWGWSWIRWRRKLPIRGWKTSWYVSLVGRLMCQLQFGTLSTGKRWPPPEASGGVRTSASALTTK